MGGGEVSALAARHPGRVASVIYLDGAYDWADNPTPEWAGRSRQPRAIRLVRRLRRPRPLSAPRRHPGPCPRRDDAHLRGHPAGRVSDRHILHRGRRALYPGPQDVPAPLLRHQRTRFGPLRPAVTGGKGTEATWRAPAVTASERRPERSVIELRRQPLPVHRPPPRRTRGHVGVPGLAPPRPGLANLCRRRQQDRR